MASAVVCLIATAALTGMISLNRNAAATRLMTNARAVVQRYADTALSAPYTGLTGSTPPAILAITGSSGAPYSEDAAAPSVYVELQGSASASLVTGTLTRTVTAVSNSVGATILNITFSLTYTYRARTYTYAVTTMRATDG